MAKVERTASSPLSDSPNPSPSPQTPPPISHQTSTFDHLFGSEEAKWPARSTSPKFGVNNDLQQNDQYQLSPTNGGPMKTVVARVKERAKKLKYSLSGRKKLEDEVHSSSIHSPMHHNPWPTLSPFDNHNIDPDDHDDEDEQEMDPEYLGAPMYESESAPENLKETARQHPRAVPVISENHKIPTSPRCKVAVQQEKDKPLGPNKSISEAAGIQGTAQGMRTKTKTGPARTRASAQEIISTTGAGEDSGKAKQYGGGSSSSSSPLTWDKGVSVREYLMKKLEPGEDERALSQAITEAISPRAASGDRAGMVKKVKGAVTSLLWNQDQPSSSKTAVSKSTAAYAFASASASASASSSSSCPTNYGLPNSSNANNAHYPQIPVPCNAYRSGTKEESNQGKILQPN